MKGAGFCFVFGSIAALSFSAGADAMDHKEQRAPSFAIEKVVSTIEVGIDIGRKSAGLVCLPNGNLHWNEGVAVLDPMRLPATVIDELILRQMPVHPFDQTASLFNPKTETRPAFAVSAEVTAARFSICQPGWGLGQPSKVKGSGELEVRWFILSRATSEIVGPITTTCQAKIGARVGGFAALFDMILRDCARRFASNGTAASLLSNR